MKIRRVRRRGDVAELLAWLKDKSPAPLRVRYFMSEETLRSIWNAEKDAIIAEWIIDAPGTRPSCWWRFDAPEPARLRLGGKGTIEAFSPHHLGLPLYWRSEGFDPRDPPRFESQTAYLKRLKLLIAGEKLRPHPLDEALPRALWPQE